MISVIRRIAAKNSDVTTSWNANNTIEVYNLRKELQCHREHKEFQIRSQTNGLLLVKLVPSIL